MKIRCDIEGLDCPHCAAKLEKLIAEDAAFKSAALNYAAGSLVLDPADESADEDELVKKAQGIADSFEDGISISLRD